MSATLQTQTEADKLAQKRKNMRELIGWVIAFAVVILLRLFVFDFIGVVGESMVPNFLNGQNVLINKVVYSMHLPERGDVLVCRYPNHDDNYIKRVIGLPGDTVAISGGMLYVNGEAVPEDYLAEPMWRDFPETVVPLDSIFVMGDNRNISMDSRDSSVGPVPMTMIRGRVEFVSWPLNKIHRVHNPLKQ